MSTYTKDWVECSADEILADIHSPRDLFEPEERRFVLEPITDAPRFVEIDERPFHQQINDKHSRRRRKC